MGEGVKRRVCCDGGRSTRGVWRVGWGGARMVLGAAGLVAAAAALAGCVTESMTTTTTTAGDGSTGPARRPTPIPSRPAGVKASTIVLSAGPPSDRDGNGFPDTVTVFVYLFGEADRFPLPLTEAGEFAFEVVGRDGVVFGRWNFPSEVAASSVRRLPPGSGYVFGLQMAPGEDTRASGHASIRATFTPAAGGAPITASGPAVRYGGAVAG